MCRWRAAAAPGDWILSNGGRVGGERLSRAASRQRRASATEVCGGGAPRRRRASAAVRGRLAASAEADGLAATPASPWGPLAAGTDRA